LRRRPQAVSRRSVRTAPAVWVRIALILTIATFTLQSFVTQTHVHFAPAVASAFADVAGAKGSSAADHRQARPSDGRRPGPTDDDPANCPLCQEILYAGNFVAPADIALLPPALAVSTIAPATPAVVHVWAISHSWQGRAPPRA